MTAITKGEHQEISRILRLYKLPKGGIDFQKVFNIPKSERITALAERDFSNINGIIIVALTMAFENLNLKRGMNEIQILNLSEAIIDDAHTDNLSLEDLLLFLQLFVRGKYPMSYESMDLPKFMKAFDIYRDERHAEGIRIRDEKIMQWQGLGDANRSTKTDPLSEHMSNISGRLSDMKEALREQKISETMKKADKYYDNR